MGSDAQYLMDTGNMDMVTDDYDYSHEWAANTDEDLIRARYNFECFETFEDAKAWCLKHPGRPVMKTSFYGNCSHVEIPIFYNKEDKKMFYAVYTDGKRD